MSLPNVVICLWDQLRASEVGCYGNDMIETPHLDSLAARGTRFVNGVTNDPSPARYLTQAPD